MALHSELRIYKTTYDLAKHALALTRNMPIDVRQVYGKRISEECLDIANLVYRANCADDKEPHLRTLLERSQSTEFLFRLLCDLKFISQGQFAVAIELTGSIGRQANGWRSHPSASPPDSRQPRLL